MDIDKDDLAVLTTRMTKEEVDRVHRLLHEWSVGPEDNFPAQLTLLTSAQLLAAASVPRAIADSRKWLEQHFAQYQQQAKANLDSFSSTIKIQQSELNAALLSHARTTQEAAGKIQAQFADAEAVAKRIKNQVYDGFEEWKKAKDDFATERLKLEKERKELAARIQWRDWLWAGLILLGMLAVGIVIGLSIRGHIALKT
jgi:hypothetical protein